MGSGLRLLFQDAMIVGDGPGEERLVDTNYFEH